MILQVRYLYETTQHPRLQTLKITPGTKVGNVKTTVPRGKNTPNKQKNPEETGGILLDFFLPKNTGKTPSG